ELVAEERRRKRQGITWDSPYGREYPEWDYIRTGQLSINFENEYVGGLRRSWNDGKHQRLESLIEDVTAGIIAYGAGIKARCEERARWKRNWDRRSRVCARAKTRREREEERTKILDELVAITSEATKLRNWLAEAERWPEPAVPNEFSRFV